jgi:hypothetical protein
MVLLASGSAHTPSGALTGVVETSYAGTKGWHGLRRIFALEFILFLGGLTGVADRFALRKTTDESK